MATAEEIQRLIRERAAVNGVPAEPFLAMAKNETNYGQAANRPGSQYQGVMQMGKDASAEVGLDRKLVNDPVANIDAAIRLAKKNSAYLGIPITQENAGVIYAAHQQGRGAVKGWLSADPNSPIANIITAKHANANGMAGMTVAQAKAKWIDSTQKLADQWAGVTSKQDLRQAAIASGDSVPNPQSQSVAVTGYTQEMVQAAQKIADNNLAAVNNFGWNPTVEGSQAQTFGKTVSTNTDTLSQLYDSNMQHLQAFTTPTKDTYLGRVGDRVKAAFNISGNALTEEYLKRAEASQSGTGKAMADQVANMKTSMENTVINPAYLDKAAVNLTNQQQAENQTYNAVTGNANIQQDLKQKLDIANMQNETEQAKVALATQKATGVAGNPEDSSLVNAARSIGIQLPDGMKTSDIKATLGDKLAVVQAVAANNGSLGSDPYTAVQTVKLLGNAAPPELVKQAQIHEKFQASVLASKGYQEIQVPLGASKEQAAMISAQNDNAKRIVINKAYQEAANNEGGLATLSGNPYSAIGGDTKTLANGLPVPKGIAPEQVGKLTAIDFISKASEAGATSVEIANFYKGLNSNATKDTNFKVFNAPAPSGKFVVQLKGVDDKMDLSTPAGVERFKALMKSTQVKLEPTNSFAKFLSAGVDFFDPQAYISGNKTGQFGYNNNLVDQVTGKPQVTLNPK